MRYTRALREQQVCQIIVIDTVTGERTVIHESRGVLFEAPNWTSRDRLIVNGDGRLWGLDPTPGSDPELIPLDGVPDLNNDHVLSPTSDEIYVSANDWQIYLAPLSGGTARRITADDGGRMHFLHGVSPDGSTLAYIGVMRSDDVLGPGVVFTVTTDGTDTTQVTSAARASDGSEFSPDGQWLYLNTELFSVTPGHSQIARIPADLSGELEQLTFDERVNWFPHLAPDGRTIAYLSYPHGTEGHPADLPVEIRLVRDGDWSRPATLVSLFGGQGTINVNSWAPDSRRLAYVAYPIAGS